MIKPGFLAYRTYGVLYVMAVALIVTLLLRGEATHQGMVLGLVSILFGLQLLARALRKQHTQARLALGVFLIVEITACVVLIGNSDPAELWLATWYALSAIGLMIDTWLRRRLGV